MEKIKKCIFFPLTGDYDNIKEPTVITPGWDYICFTNNPKLKSKNWEIKFIDNPKGYCNSRLSRKVWILNHKYVGEYDISISTGAQIQPTCNLNKFLDKFLPKDDTIDMSMAKHPVRDCIYKEAKKCIAKRLDDPKIIQKQMNFYKKNGYPKNNSLVACGIIIRKHNRKNVEEHCERWWNQVKKWSFRDQLSFNYILWKYNLVNINYFAYQIMKGRGGYFKKYKHKGNKNDSI
jgi:hypothetical protein